MKKSIFLFFAAILCAMSTNAKTIYFKPSDNWKEANAWFQVWDGKANHAFTETAISGLYQADIRDEATHIYIKRKQPNTDNDWNGGSETQIGSYNYFYNIDWSNQMGKTSIIGIVTGGHIYFDNSETKWTGNIQFVVGHDNYSRTYEMTQISNTQLWYVDISKNANHTWGDAKYYGFIASGSKFGDGGWGSSNLKNATSYTKAYTSTYSLNDGAIYYCKMSATPNGSTFSIEYKGSTNDITKFAAKQAVKVRATKNDAYANATGTWPITISTKGTYLSENGKSGNSDISGSKYNDGNQYDAVVTGKIIHTYSNLSDDYKFEGWGIADKPTSTNDSYEYHITSNTTVYAYLTQKYKIIFNGDANGSVTATADGQSLISSHKVIGGTSITLTATANEGYKFVNWTKGGEIVSTDATYTFTATEDVELVANFKATTITLTTGNNDAVIAANIGNTVDVIIERSFTANDGYYTLCVPFNMPASVIGKAYSLGTITEHVAGEGININLEEENMLSAGMPYLVLPDEDMDKLVVENVTIAEDDIAGQGVSNEEGTVNIFFQGYYSASDQTNGSTEYYVGNEGYLYNGVVDIRGLCGLFTITDKNGDPLKVRARVVTREDAATGFENITNGENTTIKLIENGQLIIIRGGEKFNAQGQKL